jgi:Skp family chaperone for outer membrane proteins
MTISHAILFDTLTYAEQLKTAGIINPELCTKALSDALSPNLYTKKEIDKMIQDALMRVDNSLRQFEERTKELKRESIAEVAALENALEKKWAKDRAALEKTWAKDRDAYQKEISRITEKLNDKIMKISNRNITVLGALIIIMGSISGLLHHII